jgi:hypothetical protein
MGGVGGGRGCLVLVGRVSRPGVWGREEIEVRSELAWVSIWVVSI